MDESVRKPRTPAQMRSAWLLAQQDADLDTLNRVKKSAEARASGLTAALAVFGLFGLTLSPEKIYNVHPNIQNILVVLLIVSLLAAVLSQVWTINAASHLNTGFQVNSGTAYRSAVIKEATDTINRLRLSRWALSIAAGLLFLAFALYLAAPVLAQSMNVKSIVKLSNGQVMCGTVKTNADGSLWLVGAQGVHIALTEAPTIVAATQCPPVSPTALIRAVTLVQVKSEAGVRCGQIFSDEKGLLWLEPRGSIQAVKASTQDTKPVIQGTPLGKTDEVTPVASCPAVKAKPAASAKAPTFTKVVPEAGIARCGQLFTAADGKLQLQTAAGIQELGDKPTFTDATECPALPATEPVAQSNNPG